MGRGRVGKVYVERRRLFYLLALQSTEKEKEEKKKNLTPNCGEGDISPPENSWGCVPRPPRIDANGTINTFIREKIVFWDFVPDFV